MELKTLNLLDLQSTHMKQDRTTIALCETLNPHFLQLADEVKSCLILSRIHELDDVALDELAWQLHIDWYDANVDIETKRKIIKGAVVVHRFKGTPFAVEEVINTYFGDGEIEEWFQYGGEPYMFRVITSNASITGELANQFTKAISSVKNVRSHLEQILVSLSGEMNMYFGGVVHTADKLEIRQVV
jgi:phage tail P2-like protein